MKNNTSIYFTDYSINFLDKISKRGIKKSAFINYLIENFGIQVLEEFIQNSNSDKKVTEKDLKIEEILQKFDNRKV